MNPRRLPVVLGTCVLLSVTAVQAADVVDAACSAGDTTAVIRMDESGAGHLEARAADQGFSCELKLELLEGPPFSESMTGMLVLSFDREACQPAAAGRRVMPEIALHVSDPLGSPATGMTMIHRRPTIFDCAVAGFDLAAIRRLAAGNGGVRIK
jgi:hypothetical protein